MMNNDEINAIAGLDMEDVIDRSGIDKNKIEENVKNLSELLGLN